MGLTTGQVTTSGTAQALSATVTNPISWIVRAPLGNPSTIYIGDKTCTTSTGYPLEPGDQIEFDRRPVAGALYDLKPSDVFVTGSGGKAVWVAFL